MDKLLFSNGKFRIMQIADVQELPNVNPDTIRLITNAVKKAKPDLAVFSGDQIYGLMPQYRNKTKEKIGSVISKFIKPLEEQGVPFAITYGNHDRQCGIPNEKQTDFYASHSGFIASAAYGDINKGVTFIPLYNDDKHIFDIVLFDSNGQSPTGEYEPVKKEQLEEYRRKRELSKNDNGEYTPCMVIQHIPFEEYFNIIKKVPFYKKGAVEGFRNHANEFFVLPDEIINNGGFMLESPATPDKNSGEFDILAEKNNCLAVSVGHDHNNSFVGEYKGIKLIYTQGCGFNVYGPKLDRGVRIFDIDITSGKPMLSTHTMTFAELTDKKISRPFNEFVLTHIPTSMEQVKRIALSATVLGVAGTFILIKKFRKK